VENAKWSVPAPLGRKLGCIDGSECVTKIKRAFRLPERPFGIEVMASWRNLVHAAHAAARGLRQRLPSCRLLDVSDEGFVVSIKPR